MKYCHWRKRSCFRLVLVIFCCGSLMWAGAQKDNPQHAALFTPPKHYAAPFASAPPVIDGSLHDEGWSTAPWTDLFEDIESDLRPRPSWATKVKMLWDDSCLYIAAAMEEPHVWASLKQHDDIVYRDNDFEVFIDPDNDTHQYVEIEVNALGTIFDLFMSKPYRNGGEADIPYTVTALRSAVQVQGTLNQPNDRDSGWIVEMAIPFRALAAGEKVVKPSTDALWRINFSRVQWDTDIVGGAYRKRKDAKGAFLPEHNWVWSPQGVINMHYPERWGYLTFIREANKAPDFKLPYSERQRQELWRVYYAQQEHKRARGRYAATLEALGWKTNAVEIDGRKNTVTTGLAGRGFKAMIRDEGAEIWLDESGRVIARFSR